MKTFVVLAAHGVLERACSDLAAQFGFMKRHHPLWIPDEMLAVWVGSEPDIVSIRDPRVESSRASSPRRALHVRSTIGVSGLWTMFSVDDSTITRVGLLDELVAGDADVEVGRGPRFIPIFLRSASEEARRSELAQMSSRYPNEVRTPLLMNPMTGALSLPTPTRASLLPREPRT